MNQRMGDGSSGPACTMLSGLSSDAAGARWFVGGAARKAIAAALPRFSLERHDNSSAATGSRPEHGSRRLSHEARLSGHCRWLGNRPGRAASYASRTAGAYGGRSLRTSLAGASRRSRGGHRGLPVRKLRGRRPPFRASHKRKSPCKSAPSEPRFTLRTPRFTGSRSR
jgi:hypothetical protein